MLTSRICLFRPLKLSTEISTDDPPYIKISGRTGIAKLRGYADLDLKGANPNANNKKKAMIDELMANKADPTAPKITRGSARRSVKFL